MISVDTYARQSAECLIEGLERHNLGDLISTYVRFHLAFYYFVVSFVSHDTCGTPQIKFPNKKKTY